ncbi:MAG TPA: NgoFVII family restriction endonuclease [Candidatus Atribacteria bacterium]|nr:NgoFVII family restriction endonuclease [Candidatus Atribacteria bacterium]
MKIKIIGPSPAYTNLQKLGDYLKDNLLNVKKNGWIKILVALVDKNLVKLLENKILTNVTDKSIVFGINLGIDRETLKIIYKVFNKAFIYYNPSKYLFFHPKLYIIKLSTQKAIVIFGSSNFTYAGFYENFEMNIAIELDLKDVDDAKFFDDVTNLFNRILTSKAVKKLDKSLINSLKRLPPPLETIHHDHPMYKHPINKLLKFFKQDQIDQTSALNFVMTLSYNDVSNKRVGDKYIRIPKRAVEQNPQFWSWPNDFTPSQRAGHPERYVAISYKGKTSIHRMYYVKTPREFRLVFPQIYSLGKNYQNSIFWLRLNETTGKYSAKVVEKRKNRYKNLLKFCTETCPRGKAKKPKKWGYFW